MTGFIGVVDKQPESAWGIWFPDVAGCTSAASTLDDLFPNACQALEFHLEDIEEPLPRSAEEILKLQDVRNAFDRGAFLMMVPRLLAEETEARTNDACVAGVVGKDPGSAFGVWFPDVPRCHAAADEEADVLEKALDALKVHLDGEEMPCPRALSEILQIKEVREDLVRGDFLVSVPVPPAKQVSRDLRER